MFIVNKKNRYIKDENIRGKDTMYGIGSKYEISIIDKY